MTDVSATPDVGALYPVAPPTVRDLLGELGKARRQKVQNFPSVVVDPSITPRDRILVGAQVHDNSPGADLDAYELWRAQRVAGAMPQTPIRPGISEKQAKILATPDDHIAQAKAFGAVDDVQAAAVAGWLAIHEKSGRPSAPVDIARFDRVVEEGLLNDRSIHVLYGKMLNGRLADDGEAAELSSIVGKVARALDAFGDDLTLGSNGKLVGIDTTGAEPALRVHFTKGSDDDPVFAPGALQALPGESLPVGALAGDVTKDGYDLYVGATDATFAGVADETSDAQFRKGFPAVEGVDGTPRWLAAKPVLLDNLNVVERAARRNPTAVVDLYLQTYPGFLPYDSIVFELDQPSPRASELGAVRLGPGASAGPEFSARRYTADDLIDERTAGDALFDGMWAIFDDSDKAKLGPRHSPITVTGPNGRTGRLVFGISPSEAAEATFGFVYTHDGIATRRDDFDEIVDRIFEADDDDDWELSVKDGTTVSFSPAIVEAPLDVARTSRPVDRWHLPLDERSVKLISGLANHLETLGATNIVAYASIPNVEGFQRAREHVYSDGGSGFAVARTVDPVLGDPNGLPVWVRDASALPTRWVEVPVDAVDTNVEELTAQRRGQKWVVDASAVDDIAPQVRQAHQLAQRYSYNNVELRGDNGVIPLVRAR